jgi:hypothetical protein
MARDRCARDFDFPEAVFSFSNWRRSVRHFPWEPIKKVPFLAQIEYTDTIILRSIIFTTVFLFSL